MPRAPGGDDSTPESVGGTESTDSEPEPPVPAVPAPAMGPVDRWPAMFSQMPSPPTEIEQLDEGMFLARWDANSPLMAQLGISVHATQDPHSVANRRQPVTITVLAMRSDLYKPSFIADAPGVFNYKNWLKKKDKRQPPNYPNQWLVDRFKPRGNLAWCHASYTNKDQRTSKNLPEEALIGMARGPKPKLIQYLSAAVPKGVRDVFNRVHYPNRSYCTLGPLLSRNGVAQFTPAMLEQNRFQYHYNIEPGTQHHMEHSNTRCFSVFPATHSRNNAFMIAVITTVNGVALRGPDGQGASGPVTSALAAHLDGLNENPGFAVNHDGGPIAKLEVVGPEGNSVASVQPGDYTPSSSYMVFYKARKRIRPDKNNVPWVTEVR